MLGRVLSEAATDGSPEVVDMAVRTVRQHLEMEVAYVSQIVGDNSIFLHVDAPGFEHMIHPGASVPLNSVYCPHIIAGRLPELMSDAAEYDLARELPITGALPIGAHMSVPLRHADGSVFGMFCCLSRKPNKSLNERDLKVMRVLAEMATRQIISKEARVVADREQRKRIQDVIDNGEFDIAYQPIWDVRTRRPKGFEALCRFRAQPYLAPDLWFGEANSVGLQTELEVAVLRKALAALTDLPEAAFLSVNASPQTVLAGVLQPLFAEVDSRRVILEITEHAAVSDYSLLRAALAPLRACGVKLAIDDAGAGYSGLTHIIELNPDVIKLDMDITRTVDSDPARRALASAMIFFSAETGCVLVAEGIETEEELETLRSLGVPRGQGYLLGRPCDLAGACRLFGELAASGVA